MNIRNEVKSINKNNAIPKSENSNRDISIILSLLPFFQYITGRKKSKETLLAMPGFGDARYGQKLKAVEIAIGMEWFLRNKKARLASRLVSYK